MSAEASSDAGFESIPDDTDTVATEEGRFEAEQAPQSGRRDADATGNGAEEEQAAGSGRSSDGTAEGAASAPRSLRYIDAWKEWHTMEVDPAVRECLYDPEWFLPYITEDIAKNIAEDSGAGSPFEDAGLEVLQGVDVSEHQGVIDWEAVAEAGFRFAFIRVGYRGYGEAGTLCEDSTAVSNLRAAKAADLQVGTYFFSQALNEEEARQEAALVLRVIEESGVSPDLPLMYDPELIRDDEGRANGITREQVARNTAAFRDEVESASPWTADIYANLPWEDAYFDGDTLNQYDIWYADYEPKPQTPYHFTWWQYTNEGSAPGIEGPVDLNLWIRRAPGG